MKKNTIFVIFAVFFTIAAIYHLVAVFYDLNQSPVWRNILFVGINLLAAYGLLKRPKLFLFFFIILVIQQLISHGNDLLVKFVNYHSIDWISLIVVIAMPVMLFFLILDRKNKLVNSSEEKH